MLGLTIILGGNAGAGKDTFGQMLVDRFKALAVPNRLDSYAWTLKQVVHLKYGIPMLTLLGDKTVKESTYRYGKSVRRILQDEGEYARQTCGATVWADRLVERLLHQEERVAIVTDARHPNEEITGMRRRLEGDGRLTLVVRVVNPRVEVTRGHPSEDLIADASNDIFDLVVSNTGSLDDLRRTAVDVANAALLLHQSGKRRITSKLMAYSAGPDGWPYPSKEDADAEGAKVHVRIYTNLKGTIVDDR